MITVGVFSDTHQYTLTEEFKKKVKKIFGNIGMLIHAGDMTTIIVHDFLSNWNLVAVRGNMDDAELGSILPVKRVIEIGGKNVGIIHGRGRPGGLEDLVCSEFAGVDAIIYGHSHIPLVTKRGKTHLFNPGAFTGSYRNKGSAGIMEIGDSITFRHVEVD